jgi:hypothetical protein
MREYDDYHAENIRLYTPVLQRVIILAAVIIAVPVMMWTITTFVRSYVARPKLPALEHVVSTNMPARIPTITLSSPSSAPSPSDQSAPQRIDEASVSDTSPAAETTGGRPNLASLPNASAPPTAANGPSGTSLQAMQTSSSAITATASTTGDISTTPSAPPIAPAPRLSPAPRSGDNGPSIGAPSSSDRDRSIAWPNPNTTSPPDFAAPRLAPPAPPAPPARTAAAEVLPANEPIRGPVPLPRQRPGIFAVAAAATGPVPLPRARPADAPAEAANSVIEPASGYRPGLDSDR